MPIEHVAHLAQISDCTCNPESWINRTVFGTEVEIGLGLCVVMYGRYSQTRYFAAGITAATGLHTDYVSHSHRGSGLEFLDMNGIVQIVDIGDQGRNVLVINDSVWPVLEDLPCEKCGMKISAGIKTQESLSVDSGCLASIADQHVVACFDRRNELIDRFSDMRHFYFRGNRLHFCRECAEDSLHWFDRFLTEKRRIRIRADRERRRAIQAKRKERERIAIYRESLVLTRKAVLKGDNSSLHEARLAVQQLLKKRGLRK